MRRYLRLAPAFLGLAGLFCITLAAFLVAPIAGLLALGGSLLAVAVTVNGVL